MSLSIMSLVLLWGSWIDSYFNSSLKLLSLVCLILLWGSFLTFWYRKSLIQQSELSGNWTPILELLTILVDWSRELFTACLGPAFLGRLLDQTSHDRFPKNIDWQNVRDGHTSNIWALDKLILNGLQFTIKTLQGGIISPINAIFIWFNSGNIGRFF